MKVSQLLQLLREQPGTHFFVCTPDDEGMVTLVPRALEQVASTRNVRFLDAKALTVGEARQVAWEAAMAPEGTDRQRHFVVRRTEKLSAACVGALLLAVEEAARARFIFISTHRTPETETLASRSTCVELPFLSKKAVLGNLQALRQDAKAADEKNLWDGTLGGTAAAVRHARDHDLIRKAVEAGLAGFRDLYALVDSPAFDAAMEAVWSQAERDFVAEAPGPSRRMLATFLALGRREHESRG